MKVLHTAGSIGMAGGLAAFMIVIYNGPDPSATEAYLAHRASLDQISSLLIVPSIAVVFVSGVLAMAIHFPFQNAGWVWIKLILGFLIFESSLATIDAPAAAAVRATEQAIAGDLSVTELGDRIRDYWSAWWILMSLAALNVILAIWRPRRMPSFSFARDT